MARVLHYLRRAAANPERALTFVSLNLTKSRRMVRDGRYAELAGYLVELLTGRNPYLERLRSRNDGPLIERDVRGHSMLLSATDPGISRSLLAYGVHEQRSSDVFVRELEAFAADVDGRVTVLDIGANLGYFCLLEAGVLGTRGRIYAFEPQPENADLLAANVTHNDYDGIFDIDRCAVGNRTETVKLRHHDFTNRHTIWTPPDVAANEEPAATGKNWVSLPDRGHTTVEQVSIDDVLAEKRIDPADVHVIRMDVDGYEAAVFEGMASVLAASSPLVLYVELHPQRLTTAALDDLLDTLESGGFEIRSAVANGRWAGMPIPAAWYGMVLDVDDFGDLRRTLVEDGYWVELVARR